PAQWRSTRWEGRGGERGWKRGTSGGINSRHGRACPGHPRLAWYGMVGAFVYFMTNRPNGILYAGVTNDAVRRAYEHREGLVEGFTKRYRLHRLVYVEEHESIAAAIQREKSIKRWPRAWKVRLIQSVNPDWDDLYETLV